MGSLAFAGLTYRDRLSVGFYGEVSSAANAAGHALRVLHVSPGLARLPGFAEALARFGGELGVLEHRTVVATRTLGRTPEGVLVVVTEAVDAPLAVDRALRGGPPPAEIALGLGIGLSEALAVAHARGIVHGRVHPCSLLVDAAGAVKLDHFAVARALASTAARTGDPDPTGQFRGYIAPELAAGAAPTAAGDVYGAGVLLYALYGGDPTSAQPGRIRATTTIRRVVSRAMDPDPAGRFADGAALRDALVQAAAMDAGERATTASIATWIDEARMRAGDDLSAADLRGAVPAVDDLDDATDDLLGSLGGGGPSPLAAAARPVAPAAIDNVLASLGDDTSPGMALSAHQAREEPDTRVEDEPADMDEPSQLTVVDEPPQEIRDPISELIELGRHAVPAPTPTRSGDSASARLRLDSGGDDEFTPLPPPSPERDGSFTGDGRDILAGTGRRRILEAAAVEAIAELEQEEASEAPAEQPARARTAAKPAPAPRLISEPTVHVARRGIPGWVWLLLTLAVLGGLLWVVWTQTNVFHPERADAERRQREAENRAKEARLRGEQQRGAHITVSSDPEGAAVWLLLGTTPLDTIPLPSYMPHQLRLERRGYKASDLSVLATAWSGDRALVSGKLERGDADTPAYPPELPPGADQGFAGSGTGIVHVDSEPSAAEVWLLVGYTNEVDMKDFPAGRRYEFSVRKDGFLPEPAIIEEAEWPDHASLEPGAMKQEMSKSVVLHPKEPGRKKPN